MNYVGDFDVGANVFIWYNTFDSNDPSASVTTTNLINTDVHIYKDDSLTQRTNAAGVAVDVDVDTFAGVHKITIDTADNTVNDFYEAGHDYAVVVEGTTVDSGTVNACVGTFSIANRRVAGQMAVSSIEALTDQSNFTLTTGEASANNDAYNGCTIIVTDQVTKIQKAIGHISDYVGATRAIVLYAAPLQTAFTMAVGDSVEIIATSVFANVNTVGLTAQTANDNGADINTLITNVGSPVNIDAGGATLSDNLKKIADDNSGATFDAATDSLNKIRDDRTLPAADYVVVGDTLARVTLTDTVTTYTGNTKQTGDNFARLAAPAGASVSADIAAIKTVDDAIKVVTDNLASSATTIVSGTVSHDNTAATTTIFFSNDITEATADHYKGRIIIFTSGAVQNQASDITAYALDTGEGKFTVTALTEAPADNVTFVIV